MKQLNFNTSSLAPTGQRVVLPTGEDFAISFDSAVTVYGSGYAPVGETVALSADQALEITSPVDGSFDVVYPSGVKVKYQVEICDENITTHSEGGGGGGDIPSDLEAETLTLTTGQGATLSAFGTTDGKLYVNGPAAEVRVGTANDIGSVRLNANGQYPNVQVGRNTTADAASIALSCDSTGKGLLVVDGTAFRKADIGYSGAFKPFSHYVEIDEMPEDSIVAEDDTLYNIVFPSSDPVSFVATDMAGQTRFGILTQSEMAGWTITGDISFGNENRILPYNAPTAGQQHMCIWQNLGVYDDITWWGCQTY